MGILGVISTRLVMERSDLFKNSAVKIMKNELGKASVFMDGGCGCECNKIVGDNNHSGA
jgi:hypothetical protein